jgi:TonB family protein
VAYAQAPASGGNAIDLNPYQTVLERRLTSAWAAPDVPFGGCSYTFRINSGGDMTDLSLKDSSGVDSLDNSCKAAIAKSAPFSTLPQGLGSAMVDAHFDIGGQEYNVNCYMTAVPVALSAVPSQDGTSPQASNPVLNQAMNSLSSPAAVINPVDLSPYIAGVKGKIEQTWSPAQSSAGLVSCSFTIGPDGTLSAVKVIPSFGTSNFDQSASDAIAKCDPFPQLPQGVNSLSLMATFEKNGERQKIDIVQN